MLEKCTLLLSEIFITSWNIGLGVMDMTENLRPPNGWNLRRQRVTNVIQENVNPNEVFED
jgi:hypothetical protein